VTSPRLWLYALTLMGFVLPVQLLADTAPLALESYTAEYRVSRGNFIIGRATITLKIDNNNRYHYHGHTKPVGLVAVFRKDEITEVSRGLISNTKVKPGSYHYKHKKAKKVRQVDLVFDWSRQTVTNRTAGSHWKMSIPNDAQDKFSQQLALMTNLNQGKGNSTFQVADGGRLKIYHFRADKKALIKTDAGEFNAIKVIRQKGNRPSRAVFWMAPELNHVAIRIVKHEGDGKFIMELQKITWLTDNASSTADAKEH